MVATLNLSPTDGRWQMADGRIVLREETRSRTSRNGRKSPLTSALSPSPAFVGFRHGKDGERERRMSAVGCISGSRPTAEPDEAADQ
jgi:hypothetical protein